MKKAFFSFLIFIVALMAANVTIFAQRETETGIQVEKDLALLRRDLRAEKKKIIALNLPLTEVEATKFWPVYDEYTAAMAKHNDEFYGLIKDYAANQKTLTDTQATAMLSRWAQIQVDRDQTRMKYVPLVEKVISGKKAALFFQIDRRLWALLDLQVASEIPLVIQ